MKTLTVDLGSRSYPIHIGAGLLSQPELLTRHIAGQQVLVVTNTTVAPLYLDQLLALLDGYQVDTIALPDGEQYKNLDVLNTIFTRLLEKRFDRGVTLIALGGGVVGDMTGFAAASYQRGVAFIQIPTTLLAQVDSSVGGKTGVNHPLGKNMIGAFHQPQLVLADIDTLRTLEPRQLSAGLAEVIKYGLINDVEFFAWLEQKMDALMALDGEAMAYAIERSCADKAAIVAADERESGQRALLNLGHTFGHAIETGMGYGEWLHGEAVGTGMLIAAEVSARMGWMEADDVARIRRLLERARLPLQAPADMSGERFLELMAVDKKVLSGKLRFVLMRGIGQSFITGDVTPAQIAEAIDAHHGQA